MKIKNWQAQKGYTYYHSKNIKNWQAQLEYEICQYFDGGTSTVWLIPPAIFPKWLAKFGKSNICLVLHGDTFHELFVEDLIMMKVLYKTIIKQHICQLISILFP